MVGDGPHSVLLRGIREAHSGPGLGGHSLALGREEQLALVLRQLLVELVDLVLDERLAGLVLGAGVGLEALDLAGQILHARLVDGAVAVVLDEKLLEVVFLLLQGLNLSAVRLVRALRLGLVLVRLGRVLRS